MEPQNLTQVDFLSLVSPAAGGSSHSRPAGKRQWFMSGVVGTSGSLDRQEAPPKGSGGGGQSPTKSSGTAGRPFIWYFPSTKYAQAARWGLEMARARWAPCPPSRGRASGEGKADGGYGWVGWDCHRAAVLMPLSPWAHAVVGCSRGASRGAPGLGGRLPSVST